MDVTRGVDSHGHAHEHRTLDDSSTSEARFNSMQASNSILPSKQTKNKQKPATTQQATKQRQPNQINQCHQSHQRNNNPSQRTNEAAVAGEHLKSEPTMAYKHREVCVFYVCFLGPSWVLITKSTTNPTDQPVRKKWLTQLTHSLARYEYN